MSILVGPVEDMSFFGPARLFTSEVREDRRLESKGAPTSEAVRINHQLGVAHLAAGVVPVGINWGQQHAKLGCLPCGCSPHKFRVLEGRWDRNRTCNLRSWSALPFVQHRSGTYTRCLEMPYFDLRKCVDVHQSSTAFTGVGVNIGVTGDR